MDALSSDDTAAEEPVPLCRVRPNRRRRDETLTYGFALDTGRPRAPFRR